MNADNHGSEQEGSAEMPRRGFFLSVSICVYLWLILLTSCGSPPTDLRTLVPADTLVYLETNDLGAALQPVMEKPSEDVKSWKIDLSSLKDIQLAVAVTGIETSEQKLNDEQSNAQIKPKFVAVANTHAWHFQAVRFAEQKLGAFVSQIYGSKPTLDEPERDGGRDMTWTAADGRKAYAFVTGSVVYFSNDRESLDKTLAVRAGASSLASTGKVRPTSPEAIASGYASTQGIAQLADVAGLKTGASASEDPQVQSVVAAILPQLIREMVKDVTWTEKKVDGSVADTYQIAMTENVAAALKDTQPADLEVRLRNTIISLLVASKLDDKVRSQVADAIVASVKAGDRTRTQFNSTGMERATMSDTGLIGTIVAALTTAASPPV
jgi:hypothetical protein